MVRQANTLIVIVFAVILAIGAIACSTATLPANATPDQRKTAQCQDAQLGYNLSVVMLEQHMISPEAQAYWQSYKAGAALAIQTYCTTWTQPQPTKGPPQ